jgi:hypothetical protein
VKVEWQEQQTTAEQDAAPRALRYIASSLRPSTSFDLAHH